MTGLAAALSLGFVTIAIVRHDGHYDTTGLCLIAAAFAVALVGACHRPSVERDATAARWLPWILGLTVAGNFGILFRRSPGLYISPGTSLLPFRCGVVIAAVLAVSYVMPSAPQGRFTHMRLPLLMAIYLALGAWTIHASPQPAIDVWHFQQRAADLLLAGRNPWAADYPNIYEHTNFTGSALMVDGRIHSFPYPPLSLLLSTAGALAGDVRWALLVATTATVALITVAARRLGAAPGHVTELASIAFLFHARSFFLIEQSWTEPFVALAGAACVWALVGRADVEASGRGHAKLVLSIAALLSVKQYGLLLAPALWRHGRVSGRHLAMAAVVAALVAAPFVIWDARALWDGVVVYQWAQPFRSDSLSLPAFWARAFGSTLWQGLGLVAALITASVCAWLAPRRADPSAATMALAGAAAYLAFFALAKQAFFNYYWGVSALLVMAIAVRGADRGSVPGTQR